MWIVLIGVVIALVILVSIFGGDASAKPTATAQDGTNKVRKYFTKALN
jgi:hypothetical protein